MALELEGAGPAARTRLSDVVLHHLMNKILAGELKPGDELPSETDLATAFQVSKPTVRDALRHLAVLGLAEIRQGRPSTIGRISSTTLSQFFRFAVAGAPRKFADIIAVRKAIECVAAPAAARYITDAEIGELRAILDRWKASTTDYERWVQLDVSFHQLVASASRNVLLPFVMDALRGLSEDVMREPYARRLNREPEKTYQRHLALGNAIAARNPDLALKLMEEHFDFIIKRMAAAAPDPEPPVPQPSTTRATRRRAAG